MLIAQEKRKNNTAEYLLYMWQVEDTIRACRFDINVIDEKIISQFKKPEKVMAEIRDWYANIIVMMHEEDIMKSGHLKMVKAVQDDLYELHKKLIQDKKDPKYEKQFNEALPNIREFATKMADQTLNEIEVCLSALYALLLLRLQKKTISAETSHAMQSFSNLLSLLSKWHVKIEAGEVEL